MTNWVDYLNENSKDLDKLRMELKNFFMVSSMTKVDACKSMGISTITLYKFLNGQDIIERTCMRMSHFLWLNYVCSGLNKKLH